MSTLFSSVNSPLVEHPIISVSGPIRSLIPLNTFEISYEDETKRMQRSADLLSSFLNASWADFFLFHNCLPLSVGMWSMFDISFFYKYSKETVIIKILFFCVVFSILDVFFNDYQVLNQVIFFYSVILYCNL